MGCNLKDIAPAQQTNLKALAGQRVGIDAFLTAFQFLTTMRDRSPQGDGMPLRDEHGNPVSHLMGFLHRTTTLLGMGIKPVFVFDGQSPDLKADEMAAGGRAVRKQKRSTRKPWQQVISDWLRKWQHASCIIHPKWSRKRNASSTSLGVPWVTAAAEGEAQAAVMAAKGQLDVVATQDWDALLYGSPVLVRNLMDDGTKRYGRVVHAQSIDLDHMLKENDLSREQLVDLAIMIGTDYHPGIKGIGPKTGLKLIREYITIEAVCEAKGKEVPQRLDEIREIFLDHPAVDVPDEALQQGTVDRKGLIQFLQVERQFSQRRMDQAFEKLKEAGLIREGGQTSLFSFDG